MIDLYYTISIDNQAIIVTHSPTTTRTITTTVLTQPALASY